MRERRTASRLVTFSLGHRLPIWEPWQAVARFPCPSSGPLRLIQYRYRSRPPRLSGVQSDGKPYVDLRRPAAMLFHVQDRKLFTLTVTAKMKRLAIFMCEEVGVTARCRPRVSADQYAGRADLHHPCRTTEAFSLYQLCTTRTRSRSSARPAPCVHQ